MVSELSRHTAISDIHHLSDSSLAVSFYRPDASDREQVMLKMKDLLFGAVDGNESSVERVRKTFDSNSAAARVDAVITERLRPGVNADGGDLELVELTDDGVAVIKLIGACNGCPSSSATLKHAVEKTLLHFCAGDVTAVKQAPSETPTIDSSDVVGAMNTAGSELPSVISHNHSGVSLAAPLSTRDFPIVSLFARKLDERLVNRVKFASTVTIPKESKVAIDVWVSCTDCGAKKRLEDVNQLIMDAREKKSDVDRVGVIICPACAVIVKEQ